MEYHAKCDSVTDVLQKINLCEIKFQFRPTVPDKGRWLLQSPL